LFVLFISASMLATAAKTKVGPNNLILKAELNALVDSVLRANSKSEFMDFKMLA
jgi:hypothetical protein